MVPSAPHVRPSAPRSLAVAVTEAPICELPSTTTLVPAGGTSSECELRGVLAREVPTSIAICGVGIPDGNARCANGDPATQGTFMKLLPDLTKTIGDAYVTPLAVHVTDFSNDGLIQPGETVHLVIEVLNAGPFTITGANATLVSPRSTFRRRRQQPGRVTISEGAEPFGDIIGTLPARAVAPPRGVRSSRRRTSSRTTTSSALESGDTRARSLCSSPAS
jgi:hypothetical protein